MLGMPCGRKAVPMANLRATLRAGQLGGQLGTILGTRCFIKGIYDMHHHSAFDVNTY
jgi:hypothetical protein